VLVLAGQLLPVLSFFCLLGGPLLPDTDRVFLIVLKKVALESKKRMRTSEAKASRRRLELILSAYQESLKNDHGA